MRLKCTVPFVHSWSSSKVQGMEWTPQWMVMDCWWWWWWWWWSWSLRRRAADANDFGNDKVSRFTRHIHIPLLLCACQANDRPPTERALLNELMSAETLTDPMSCKVYSSAIIIKASTAISFSISTCVAHNNTISVRIDWVRLNNAFKCIPKRRHSIPCLAATENKRACHHPPPKGWLWCGWVVGLAVWLWKPN